MALANSITTGSYVSTLYHYLGFGTKHVIAYGKSRITDALKSNEELLMWKTLALTDELTGLHNRRSFLLQIEHQISIAKRFKKTLNLVFVDVDNFKQINDTQGHAAGDQALIKLAKLLKHSVRGTDVIARIGGDEFCIIITGDSNAEVQIVISRLQNQVHKIRLNEECNFSCSFGVSVFEKDGMNTEELYKAADEAMYKNKQLKLM
ncbi:GGDEF domain-containing protein [Agaribacter flavus]|uniref:diguanylate cyclase n=1 Tax=Agaribacter flavus TaxID=1902781 RepID=A0ABV7FU07_9ALTE